MKPSRELRDHVLGWLHDFANRDPSFVESISKSDGTVFIGTDSLEFWIGGQQIRAIVTRQLEEVGPFKVEAGAIFA